MTKPIDYLCHKINTIQETELYYDYRRTYQDLKNNQEYQNLLIEIAKVDKQLNQEKYFELKQAITHCEIEFRHYERELNTYVNYMLRKFNQIYKSVNLEK